MNESLDRAERSLADFRLALAQAADWMELVLDLEAPEGAAGEAILNKIDKLLDCSHGTS